MERVSSNLISNNLLYDLQRQQEGLAKVQKQLSSQSKIQLPEDDPVATAELMHQKSRLNDVSRFERNITLSSGRLKMTEGSLTAFSEALQRAKELSVQGATSIYSLDQRKAIATEVNQLLEHTVALSNIQYQGSALFGGAQSGKQAVSIEKTKLIDPQTGFPSTSGEEMIQKVHYQGDTIAKFAEIGRGEYIKTNLTGAETFFAQNQMIVSGTPGSSYIANRDQSLRIDGAQIEIKAGDNLQSVVDKINNSGINTQASIDNSSGQNLLVFNTTSPHQILFEDLNGGSVLQDLGVLASPGAAFPNNYAPTASVYESSIFDTLIELRNGLIKNDTEAVNRSIGGIDESINNITNKLASVGSIQSRIEKTQQRLSQEKLYTTEVISALNDTNVAESVIKMKQLEQDLQTSLQVGGNLLPKTLIDYLR